MNFCKLLKSSRLKSSLVFLIFFSTATLIVSQNYGNSAKDNISKELFYQESEEYEEIEVFISNFNSYILLSITSSKLPDKELLIIGIPLLSFFLISNVIIIIKRQSKLSKSELQNESVDCKVEVQFSAQEGIILDLIKDYLSKNRFLEINKVVSYLNTRLPNSKASLNRNGIESVINKLIKKSIIVDGSKLTRFELLDNSNRLMMYNLIIENPGIHFMNIVNILGMSIFLVKWHINMLLKFNLIKNSKVENREIYFDSKLSEKIAKRSHFLNRERSQRIIHYLKNKPDGCPKYRISKELKLHPVTTTKYIQKLEEFDVVLSKKLSNKTLYSLNKNSHF